MKLEELNRMIEEDDLPFVVKSDLIAVRDNHKSDMFDKLLNTLKTLLRKDDIGNLMATEIVEFVVQAAEEVKI